MAFNQRHQHMSIVSEIHEQKDLDVALFGLNMMLCKMSLSTNLFLPEPPLHAVGRTVFTPCGWVRIKKPSLLL